MPNTDQQRDETVVQPIHRLIFRAQSLAVGETSGDDILRESLPASAGELDLVSLCVFGWYQDIFVYAESENPAWTPDEVFASSADSLARWPGSTVSRSWIPMMDIFHYQRCESKERWKRTELPEKRSGRVIRLRPEMVSSYIFYHYQMQEEAPRGAMGSMGFGTIALHENLLFFYVESPNFVDEPFYTRRLTTNNTPTDWPATMDPHFMPWSDSGERLWRDCRMIGAV